jgi:hypothetical protein
MRPRTTRAQQLHMLRIRGWLNILPRLLAQCRSVAIHCTEHEDIIMLPRKSPDEPAEMPCAPGACVIRVTHASQLAWQARGTRTERAFQDRCSERNLPHFRAGRGAGCDFFVYARGQWRMVDVKFRSDSVPRYANTGVRPALKCARETARTLCIPLFCFLVRRGQGGTVLRWTEGVGWRVVPEDHLW